MALDPRTAERVRDLAADLARGHGGDRSTRAAFLERAIEAVDRITHAVDDQKLRDAIDAGTDTAFLEALSRLADTPSPTSTLTDPLAAAKERGEQAKREILALQGHMIDAADVAIRLGIDVAEVEHRRLEGRLLALPTESGMSRFPSWQFRDDGLLPGLEDILSHMSVRSPWMRAQFFFTGDLRLDGQTPLEVLRCGDIEAVRRAGAAYGEQLAS